MKVLLTNDDGINALGLRYLYHALIEAGHKVFVVAPMTEQSAVGHSITIHAPLRIAHVKESNFQGIGVHGTPSDCVKLAIGQLLPEKPDMVISGINEGANVGPDIMYSGTVAAATEGAHLGFPALAISFDSFTNKKIPHQAKFAVELMQSFPWDELPARRVMNLNLPDLPIDEYKEVALCPQTTALWQNWHKKNTDPRGNDYWWLDGNIPEEDVDKGSDRDLLTKGHPTLTPLRYDFTDNKSMEALKNFKL